MDARATRDGRRPVVALVALVALGLLHGATATSTSAQSPGEAQLTELEPVAGDMALVRAVAAGSDGVVAMGTRSCRSGKQGRLKCFGEVWSSDDGSSWRPVGPRASGIDLGDPSRCGTGGPQPGLVDRIGS